MRKEWILFSLGVAVFLLPFMGFPSSWETVFLFVAGAAIAGLSFSRMVKERMQHEREEDDATAHG